MSSHDLNSNPVLVKQLIKQYQDDAASARQCPDSVLPAFERELHQLGFQFEVLNQAEALLPKHKKTVLPLVMKYYTLAKNPAEKNELLRWLHHRGFEEAVPMLLADYYSDRTPDTTRWFISDTLFEIRSRKYVQDYLRIVSDPTFGRNRQMLVLLLGKLKEESAIPVLIDLLEDEEVRLHAISALGQFKREEFRGYFERFQNASHAGWRKYARESLKKLDKQHAKEFNKGCTEITKG